MSCVICGSENYNVLLHLKCGGFDKSSLYDTVTVVSCRDCYHVYNLLTEKQKNGLMEYYTNEYSECNISSPNKKGDIPGSKNKDSLNRYNDLYVRIQKYIKQNTKLLDVGCAVGGFLSFISEDMKPENLYGIEPSHRFVEIAKQNVNANIRFGSAESIPFNEKFDILVCDQVVEHLIDPNIFFSEARRVLNDDGILCVSVPYATEYTKNLFFDFYFFLMREHIHHFGLNQLKNIAYRHGFDMIDANVTYPNLISDVGVLPNLTMVFVNTKKEPRFLIDIDNTVTYKIKQYINNSYKQLFERQQYIESLEGEDLSIYGVSREFHYLYNNTNLKKFDLCLYDDTTAKQKMTVDGIKVYPSHMITDDSRVMITSFAHINTLTEKLKNQGFRGDLV